MALVDELSARIADAMRKHDATRLSTLRMLKAALMNREIERGHSLDDSESLQVVSSLVKQRKDSIEQFTKGGRQELADKEAIEIKMIEGYMPKAAGEEEVTATVRAAIAEMGAPTIKDMGTVMKAAMAKFAATGTRVDGKVVSETVKRELTPK